MTGRHPFTQNRLGLCRQSGRFGQPVLAGDGHGQIQLGQPDLNVVQAEHGFQDPQRSQEAELAHFDPGQPETLAAALTGVIAVFINVTAVGAVIADLIAAASAAGVGRTVLLSSISVRDDGTQTMSIGAQHKAIEDAVAASAPHWTFLRCGGFAANTPGWAQQIRAGDVVRVPYPQAASALIAEQDIAAAAVTVLLEDGHADNTYRLTGPKSLTQTEQVQAIGAAIGRDLRVEELPPQAFRQAATAHMPAAA